jgi:hypothetical protein
VAKVYIVSPYFLSLYNFRYISNKIEEYISRSIVFRLGSGVSYTTTVWGERMKPGLAPPELEKQIVQLAREYVKSHDPEIREKIYRLADQLEKIAKGAKAGVTKDRTKVDKD